MARRSAAGKAETHEKIVQRAAEIFRAHGSSVGIGDVMKELGLTHGGFYRHFASKDELLIAAVAQGFLEMADRLERVAAKAAPGKELAAIISAYLSPEHLRHPESWCVLATLAPELGRLPAGVRKRLDHAMQQYMQRLSRFTPGANDAERSQSFLILFSGMAGAIAMARALGDKESRDRVIGLSRDYYLRAFAST